MKPAHPRVGPTGAWAGGGVSEHHSWSPQLAAWVGDYLRGQEDTYVYDFGCGLGHYLAALEARGFRRLVGFERELPEASAYRWASDEEPNGIAAYDITQPITTPDPGNALLLEVAEHVPAFFEAAMLENVTRAVRPGGALIMSWAIRGQGGDGHVHELDTYEVLPRVFAYGFDLDGAATRAARACITQECWWFKQSLLIFRRAP